MAANPTTASVVSSPGKDGENALAVLLAAAAASMHRQQAQAQVQAQAQQQLQYKQLKTQRHQNQQQQSSINQQRANCNNKNDATNAPSFQRPNKDSRITILQRDMDKTQAPNTTSVRINKVNNAYGISTQLNNASAEKKTPMIDGRNKLSNSLDGSKLLATLVNSSNCSSSEGDQIELRNLETWHDEDEKPIDEKFFVELVDPSNPNGWSADEMFKYNEKMHNINSDYSERTLSYAYSTPLPKTGPKSIRKAVQLAREIEKDVIEKGRITPESSDDDELFEKERKHRLDQNRAQDRLHKLQQQQKHLNQIKIHQRQQSTNGISPSNQLGSMDSDTLKTNKPIPQSYSYVRNSPKPFSTSPTLNHKDVKPVTSSSRNILRSCLA